MSSPVRLDDWYLRLLFLYMVNDLHSIVAMLLNANPFENISHTREIEGVLCQGSWIPKKVIDNRLDEIAKSYQELKL